MFCSYATALSGNAVPYKDICHIRSPKLKEIFNSDVGIQKYHMYLGCLSWKKQETIEFMSTMGIRGTDKISSNDAIELFDIITIFEPIRELYKTALSFFICEKIEWDNNDVSFNIYTENKKDEEEKQLVGKIDKDIFDAFKQAILQMNYIGINDQLVVPIDKKSSKKAMNLWEKAKSFLAEQEKTKQEAKPEYDLGNIISKLSVIHPTYNLLNIYELTVFQLYDQFFQTSYLRGYDLGKQIFANHGGDKFKFEDWLKPIINI